MGNLRVRATKLACLAVARERFRRAKVSLPGRGSRTLQVKDGAEDWNRTSDTSIFSAVLYQLSYLGVLHTLSGEPLS